MAAKQTAGHGADQFSLDRMVTRFVEGIEACWSPHKNGQSGQ
jgi:hypothetical protein